MELVYEKEKSKLIKNPVIIWNVCTLMVSAITD